MRYIAAILILAFLLSCEQTGKRIEMLPDPEGERQDTLALSHIDTLNGDRWGYHKYLNDPETPQLAKDIFNNRWELKDDEPLAFLEKLHGDDKKARPFYFRVITNSFKKSDGAYSEGLGNAGYEYVLNHPDEFADYFTGQNAFSDQDLKTWADIVMLEFGIIYDEGNDSPLVKNYLDAVKKNCRKCSTDQQKVIDRFGIYLSEEWATFLKHI